MRSLIAPLSVDLPEMVTPFVLFDISRLMRNRGRPFPTGIDRIDLAIGRALVDRFGPGCLFVHASQGGSALIPHGHGAALLESLHRRWTGLDLAAPGGLRLAAGVAAGQARALFGGRNAIAFSEATYVNASHAGLPLRRGALRRLDPELRMRRFIYIHDLIPIDFPEYQRPGAAKRLIGFLDEVATARLRLATNSVATARRLSTFATERGWRFEALEPMMPHLSRSAVSEETLRPALRPAVCALVDGTTPFFMVIGTIEPRKNHLLLLQVWRDLAMRGTPPKLVVVGRRGWENEMVLDMLERSGAIAPHVVEFGDLSDVEVQALLQRARALLLPSFAEGLGLPLMEAGVLGVPAVVSDLPALREIAPPGTVFLDPLDGAGWRREVLGRAL